MYVVVYLRGPHRRPACVTAGKEDVNLTVLNLFCEVQVVGPIYTYVDSTFAKRFSTVQTNKHRGQREGTGACPQPISRRVMRTVES